MSRFGPCMTHGPFEETIWNGIIYDKCTVCGYLIFKRPVGEIEEDNE